MMINAPLSPALAPFHGESGKPRERKSAITRRRFLGGAVAATAAASSLDSLRGLGGEAPIPTPTPAPAAKPTEFERRLKLGVIGCGGRGSWIANLFKQHGGYDLLALADYFPEVVNATGDALRVEGDHRFSTLSGYKR